MLLFVLIGVFAALLAPYGFNQIAPLDRLKPPSMAHWFGTDNLGRDVLSRCIYGAQISVIIGLSGAALATIISAVIGIVSGYFGGRFDLALQRFVDAWMTFPGPDHPDRRGVGARPRRVPDGRHARIAAGHRRLAHRAQRRDQRARKHVRARRAIDRRLVVAHPVAAHPAQRDAAADRAVHDPRGHGDPGRVGPRFLGLGVPPPTPTWGGMLSGSGRTFMFHGPWLALAPGLCLTVVVYATNVFGDALRDLLDPRMRGSR